MNQHIVDIVKESVSCKDFAEHIGLSVNRSGFCCCPFHGEKTPSLKIYSDGRGWYCFGCHQGGDVINMAKLYYNTDFCSAVEQLASDFDIKVEDSPKNDSNALLRAVKRASNKSIRQKEKRLRDALEAEYWNALDNLLEVERRIEAYAPKFPGKQFDDDFVTALFDRDRAIERFEIAEVNRNGCK